MCIPLCITVINNTAQSSSDNIPSLPPHNHHSSDAVCHRRGGIIVTMKQLNSIMYAGIVNLQSSDISKTKVNQCLLCLPCFGLFSSFHAIFDVRRSQPIMRPCTVAYVITCCKPVQILVKTLISNSLQYWWNFISKSTRKFMILQGRISDSTSSSTKSEQV